MPEPALRKFTEHCILLLLVLTCHVPRVFAVADEENGNLTVMIQGLERDAEESSGHMYSMHLGVLATGFVCGVMLGMTLWRNCCIGRRSDTNNVSRATPPLSAVEEQQPWPFVQHPTAPTEQPPQGRDEAGAGAVLVNIPLEAMYPDAQPTYRTMPDVPVPEGHPYQENVDAREKNTVVYVPYRPEGQRGRHTQKYLLRVTVSSEPNPCVVGCDMITQQGGHS